MAYSLMTSYIGDSFISGFNFLDGKDASHGFVSYQNQQDALDMGLYSIDPETQVVRLGVDSTNKYALNEGRPSIRLESKEAYNHGLFIADFLHMPPSQCGVWPAYAVWTYGSPWPMGGEIDVLEGANLAYTNVISGHTSDNCFLDPVDSDLFSGERRNLDCAIGARNVGCGFDPPATDVSSYGDGFNAAHGGVYAMQWDSDYIRVWHFARGSIPSDIEAKNPDPTGWGLPQAVFGGSKCDVDTYYNNMNLVININFCGDYGAGTWKNFDTCMKFADTCEEYVANNPEAFKNAYWEIKSIDVYSMSNASPTNLDNSTVLPTVTPIITGGQSHNTSEPTTTTTMTSFSTTTVTVPGQGSSNPSPTDVPANPSRIGNHSYLGCFGSSSGFQTFDLADQNGQMTLEKCVEACNGATYAGVFENKCYCAEDLDADTRAVAGQNACDHACPGDPSEFCGGLVGMRNSTARRFLVRRDAPSTYLLSVYADVSDNDTPQPPPMSPVVATPAVTGAAALKTTTITYTTVCPADSQMLQAQEYVATLAMAECDCDEPQYMDVPMATKVVACEGCGEQGEDVVTITVPVMPVQVQSAASTYSRIAMVNVPEGDEPAQDESGSKSEAKSPLVQPQGYNQTTHGTRPANNGTISPNRPLVVAASAWGGWKDVKFSVAMSLVVVVGVATLM
ncbi:Fc.00g090650.m01.CDS01 [Cosmosporella sp. VM-42]